MKKNFEKPTRWKCARLQKLLKIMRLTFFLVLVSTMFVSAGAYSQNTKLSLRYKDIPVGDLLELIEEQTEFRFAFSKSSLNQDEKVSINVKDEKLDKVLSIILDPNQLSYKIIDRYVVISDKGVPGENKAPQAKLTVSGKVAEPSGLPLPGVTVVVKGIAQGTVTNADGNYTLANVPDGATLQFSFVGMKMQEIVVDGKILINVIMEEDAIGIDEVVAIGYGVQKKVSTTSPVSQLKGEELTKRPVDNAQQLLQGLASGVTILDQGGYPGRATATIRVRGLTSLDENDPLIIVDGVEQRLEDINPNDIESISILKDAASTAIYGSRAANGVVLVTTKRGNKEGGINITYSGYVGLRKSNNNPEHMEVGDYLRLQNIAYTNAGRDPLYTDEEINTWISTDDRVNYPLPNTWFKNKYLVKTGIQNDQNISLTGGNEKVQGRASARWQSNEGIISSVSNEIRDIKTNLDFTPNKKLKLSTDLNYRQNDSKAPVYNIFQYMLHACQWIVPKYPDGTYGLSKQNCSPLVFNDLSGRDKLNKDMLIGNFKLEYSIIPGLKLTGQYSIRANYNRQKIFYNAYTIYDYEDNTKVLKSVDKNSLYEIRNNVKESTLTSLANYNYTKEKYDFKLLVGYSEISNKQNYLKGYREDFYSNELQSISMGSDDNKDITGYDYEWGLKSFLGRANYIFDNRYIFEFNARWDGSSRFTKSNRYAFFPSVSGAWRVTQEKFWNHDNDFVNELKIRASWGRSGNQAIPLYEFYPALTSVSYTFNDELAQGYIESDMANTELTWEVTTQTDIGFDSQFLNQKLTLSFDWYKKITDGILLDIPIPGVVGLDAPQQNAGVVENKGIEFQLGLRNKHTKLRYEIFGNLGYNSNKIKNLAGTGPYISGSTTTAMYIREEGHSIDTHWGYKMEGLFQTEEEIENYPTLYSDTKPGDTKYINVVDDGEINSEDMTHLGNSFPSYNYGLTANMVYKGFEFYMNWQGAADFSERIHGALAEMGNQEGFCPDIYANDYWTEDNKNARFPRPVKYDLRNMQPSNLLIFDASYLRLKMLQVGYNLPEKLIKKTCIKKAKFTLTGTDLMTFSKLNEWHLDPEAHSSRGNYYPQTSVYSLGFIFQF